MSSFNHQIKSNFCLIMIIIEYNLPWQPDGDPPPNEKPRKKSKVSHSISSQRVKTRIKNIRHV